MNESSFNLKAMEQLISLYTYFISELPLINPLALVNNKQLRFVKSTETVKPGFFELSA